MLSFAGPYALAQEADMQKDTIVVEKMVPGNLFQNSQYNNTGAVAIASGEALNQSTTPNLSNTFSGRLAGLFVQQSNGSPGYDNSVWLVRGVGSYGSGYLNPAKLFVDGFEVNRDYLNYLTPMEIESISVLKDAAALSTFGMMGANGVIWVKTKRGTAGQPSITMQIRSGIQQPININKPLDSYDFATLYNQAVSNDNGLGWAPKYTNSDLEAYKNGTGTNVDWYKEDIKDNGYYTDADLTFNGCVGNNTCYSLVMGYANQQGLYNVINSDQTANQQMGRYNIKANIDMDLFKILHVYADLEGRIEDRKQPNYNSIMDDLASYPSNIYPVHDNLVTDDEFKLSGTALYPNNPYGSIAGLGWKSIRTRFFRGNYRFTEKLDFLTKGLYLEEAFSFLVSSRGTYGKTKNYARYFNGLPTTTDQTTSIVASEYLPGGMDQWMFGTVTMGYANNFGKHSINSAVNLYLSDLKSDGFFGYKNRFLNYNGRVNYSYDKRYIAEFGFSYFGSDGYAPDNRWGFYPAVSVAWVASNEPFLKSSSNINLLKMRASVGKTGAMNSNILNGASFFSDGRNLYQQYYASTGVFYTGSSSPFNQRGALAPLYIANKNTFAEQSIKYNLGIDLSLFKKLDVTLDVFMDKRSGILTPDGSLMEYYGANIYLDNIGKMTNKGLEISAVYTNKIGDFVYSLQGMGSYARNKIDYMAEVAPAYSYNAATGRVYGTYIGLESNGFYQEEDFNTDGTLKSGIPEPMFGKVQPGDIRYKDLDNNGYVDATDVTSIGKSPYPQWYYGFGGGIQYKGFDFNIFFQGAAGASVNLLNYPSHFMAYVNNGNAYDIAKGAWAYYPAQNIDTRATATYPRLTTQNNENNYRTSSFWIRDNNYLRIKNIEIGYDFSKLIKGRNLSKMRLYINAVNPVTWSRLLKDYDMDPETAYGYPALKSFNVGINLTL